MSDSSQPPGLRPTIHGIFQARVLEWGAIAFSRTNIRRAETKGRKTSTFIKGRIKLEVWEKETSNTISLKKNEKPEKYYTNEGTN